MMDEHTYPTTSEDNLHNNTEHQPPVREVALLQQAFSLLWWGVALISFNINIQSIELALYSTWLGKILLALGLWQLRQESRPLRNAYRCSLLQLVVHSMQYWVDCLNPAPVFFSGSLQELLLLAWRLLPILIPIVLMYYLCDGLHLLARDCGKLELAEKFPLCFWLYAAMPLLIFLSTLMPLLNYLAVPLGLPILIYLPLSIGRLQYSLPQIKRSSNATAFTGAVPVAVVLYLILTFGGAYGFFYYASAPRIPSAPYAPAVLSAEAETLRQTIAELGLDADILADLPEDELLCYQGVYDMQFWEETYNWDGGKLLLRGFVAMFPEYRLRFLGHYQWLEPPRHGYTDLMLVQGGNYRISPLESGAEIKGLSLYDRDGVTYKQQFLDKSDTFRYKLVDDEFLTAASLGLLYSYIQGSALHGQFRVYPGVQNQRGYCAFNARIYNNQDTVFNSALVYAHQKGIWNRPFMDIRAVLSSGWYSRMRHHVYETEYILTTVYYIPEEMLVNSGSSND